MKFACYPGSSPLARGLRPRPAAVGKAIRIIPARAGFTASSPRSPRWRRDHPRSRGVYGCGPSGWVGAIGSSPLARGLPEDFVNDFKSKGIIPARAGFTGDYIAGRGIPKDHPRSRGVYNFREAHHSRRLGSSPLARGLRQKLQLHARRARIIPARAGFTRLRVCGPRHTNGSSPLARGLHMRLEKGMVADRIIPARAGFTRCIRRRGGAIPDHPRSRGVYREYSRLPASRPGSSPLARGLRVGLIEDASVLRIIPARAGFTVGGRCGAPRRRDHPRSRGVYRRRHR